MSTDRPQEDTADDEPALEQIDRDECLRLLGSQVIGRLAVAEFNAAPLVVPVNFVVHQESVLFRCDYGTKFRLAVLSEQPVSFEVDEFDVTRRIGWSVLVQGRCEEVDHWQVDGPDPRPWPGGEKGHWIGVVAESVTGRRIRLPDAVAGD